MPPIDEVIPSDQLTAFMEIYPWLLEPNPTMGNYRLSDLGAQAGKYWITGNKCPTMRLAMAVDALDNVPVLAAMVATALDIRVSEDMSASQIRQKVIATFRVRDANTRE